MVYSHIWDGLLKLASLVALIITAISLNLEEQFQRTGIVTKSNAKAVVLVLAIILWAIIYRQLLSILASWLYARVSLGTSVTFSEAKALRKLFQLDFSFRWFALKDIKKLPKEQRHDALMNALSTLGPSRRAMFI